MDKVKTDRTQGGANQEQAASGPPWSFTLIVEGGVGEQSVALDKAGCGDATIGAVDGTEYADFVRGGPTFESTLLSTIHAVESVDGLTVRRVEPDDLVTAAEIATRLGRSRESIRLLISGARGSGNFPPPVSHLRSRQRLWRWSEVSGWASEIDDDQRQNATVVAAVNAILEYRRLASHVRQSVAALLGQDGAKPGTMPTTPTTSPAPEEQPTTEAAKAAPVAETPPAERPSPQVETPPKPARASTTKKPPRPVSPSSEFVAAAGPPKSIESYWNRAGLESEPPQPPAEVPEIPEPDPAADDAPRDRGRRFRRRTR